MSETFLLPPEYNTKCTSLTEEAKKHLDDETFDNVISKTYNNDFENPKDILIEELGGESAEIFQKGGYLERDTKIGKERFEAILEYIKCKSEAKRETTDELKRIFK